MNIEVTKLKYIDTIITPTNHIRLYCDEQWAYLIYGTYDWVVRKELLLIRENPDEYLFTPFGKFIEL